MDATRQERNLKVHGFEGRSYSDPPEIRLKGKWLSEFGFSVNTKITVACYENQLIITRREKDA